MLRVCETAFARAPSGARGSSRSRAAPATSAEACQGIMPLSGHKNQPDRAEGPDEDEDENGACLKGRAMNRVQRPDRTDRCDRLLKSHQL
jgi:hypothetical protein